MEQNLQNVLKMESLIWSAVFVSEVPARYILVYQPLKKKSGS